MKRDFVATCYVFSDDKVLLIFHKKLNRWLPPGGHIDPNEMPCEAAKREVLEETGVEIELIRHEEILISNPHAKSIARPYLCLLEDIPAYRDVPAHQHIDFVFLGYPVGGTIQANLDETEGLRWFTKEEVAALDPAHDILPDTQEVIAHLFTTEFATI